MAGVPQLIADLGLRRSPSAGARDAVAAATAQSLGAVEGAIAARARRGSRDGRRARRDHRPAGRDRPRPPSSCSSGAASPSGIHGRYRPAGPLLGERRPDPAAMSAVPRRGSGCPVVTTVLPSVACRAPAGRGGPPPSAPPPPTDPAGICIAEVPHRAPRRPGPGRPLRRHRPAAIRDRARDRGDRPRSSHRARA